MEQLSFKVNLKYKAMKINLIISKLEKQGYKVTRCFSGKVIAKKGQRTYIAESYNSLYSQIFN